MRVWKFVSGILSIVLSLFIIFQSCTAGLNSAALEIGEVSGSARGIVAIMLLDGGIVSITTRSSNGRGGNIMLAGLYGLGALTGYLLAESCGDLTVWASWCLLCAVFAGIGIIQKIWNVGD